MEPRLGALITYRGRPWVVVDREEKLLYLRPLGGGDEELLPISLELVEVLGKNLPHEQPSPASFPPPKPTSHPSPLDFDLFQSAARLLLRDGTAPLRSLGRVGVRPRAYQLVPLLMALKLHPVRLLIADDVGVGKTIEAGLVARELLEFPLLFPSIPGVRSRIHTCPRRHSFRLTSPHAPAEAGEGFSFLG